MLEKRKFAKLYAGKLSHYTVIGNALSKMVRDLWTGRLVHFEYFKTDLRSMTKHGNSIKPNLLWHSTKVTLPFAS